MLIQRCRDSEECKFFLHCKTRPTIESSKKVQLTKIKD